MFKEELSLDFKQKKLTEDFHQIPSIAEKLFERLSKRLQNNELKSK